MVVVFCVYYPFMVIVWIVYDWVYHMIPHINVEYIYITMLNPNFFMVNSDVKSRPCGLKFHPPC